MRKMKFTAGLLTFSLLLATGAIAGNSNRGTLNVARLSVAQSRSVVQLECCTQTCLSQHSTTARTPISNSLGDIQRTPVGITGDGASGKQQRKCQ